MPRHPDDNPETRPPADAGAPRDERVAGERAPLGLVPGPDTPPGDGPHTCLRLPPRLRVTGAPRGPSDPDHVSGARGGGGGRRSAAPMAPPARTDTPLSAADRPDQAVEDGWGDRHRPGGAPGTPPEAPPGTDGQVGHQAVSARPPESGREAARRRGRGARPTSGLAPGASEERPRDVGDRRRRARARDHDGSRSAPRIHSRPPDRERADGPRSPDPAASSPGDRCGAPERIVDRAGRPPGGAARIPRLDRSEASAPPGTERGDAGRHVPASGRAAAEGARPIPEQAGAPPKKANGDRSGPSERPPDPRPAGPDGAQVADDIRTGGRDRRLWRK